MHLGLLCDRCMDANQALHYRESRNAVDDHKGSFPMEGSEFDH